MSLGCGPASTRVILAPTLCSSPLASLPALFLGEPNPARRLITRLKRILHVTCQAVLETVNTHPDPLPRGGLPLTCMAQLLGAASSRDAGLLPDPEMWLKSGALICAETPAWFPI